MLQANIFFFLVLSLTKRLWQPEKVKPNLSQCYKMQGKATKEGISVWPLNNI